MNTRSIAASILEDVTEHGLTLTQTLEANLPLIPSEKDRAFVQAICYGVVRWYWRLEFILGQLTRKPVKDPHVRLLALTGLFQLRYMRVKPHAAVSETVSATGARTWARPLLNAILRNYQREQETLEALADASEAVATAHPAWLIKRLRQDWPTDYPGILTRNNEPPPLALRVNLRKLSRPDCLGHLANLGIAASPALLCDSAIILDTPVTVEKLPGFAEGNLSVQDTAAQFAAGLLDAAAGQRVLDLCAAPGGKTAHILEMHPDLKELVAVDVSPERLRRVRENLDRIGLDATLVAGDATRPETWWDGQPFDRILVDAPCSATGVIRRHPDIKILRKPVDVTDLCQTQQQILESAWSMLAPGGQLVYATCSILKAENEKTITGFLAKHADAREIPIEAEWGSPTAHGRQVFPGSHQMDGFYYARIRKPAE